MWLKRILLAAPCIAAALLPVRAIAEDAAPKRLSATELAVRIDGFIESALSARGIEPAPLAADAEFHRRVYLDLAGRIPTEAEARTFLADPAPDRRGKLVETLLNSPLFVRHMANTWQTVLAPPNGGSEGAFRNWLEARVQQNAPYDVMVRDLLTAPMFNIAQLNGYEGKRLNFNPNPQVVFVEPIRKPNLNPELSLNPNAVKVKLTIRNKTDFAVKDVEVVGALPQQVAVINDSPGAFFFEANEYKPENLAASTARRFLGVRLECAQCHNHPFSSWTRKQFWEFAAFFSGVQAPALNGYVVNAKNSIQLLPVAAPTAGASQAKRAITIPGTDKVVEARFPDGKSPVWKDNIDSRQTLAEWLTAPTNPYFARTGANRLWAHFFGAGIIDPVDDEPTDENPISHPELMTELSAQFVANKFDVKYLIRAITATRAYQRTSAATHAGQNQPRLFARMAVKGLTPEQLFDSLAAATGYQDPSGHPPGLIVPNTPRGDFLLMFSTQDQKTETQTSILQALTLMNGKLITDATNMSTSLKLAALAKDGTSIAKIESLYLSTLSRLPRTEESARMVRYVDSVPDARAGLADVFWALLNSSEFRFNH